jgi:hypothetical protein
MKTLKFFSVILFTISLLSCTKESEQYQNENTTLTEFNKASSDIGIVIWIDKGQRKQCSPDQSNRECCGRKICATRNVTGYDENEPVLMEDCCQAGLSLGGTNKLKILIPFNKILQSTYDNWFINNIFEAEYFPIPEETSEKLGLSKIAIKEGIYNVNTSDIGYEIIVDFEPQKEEF